MVVKNNINALNYIFSELELLSSRFGFSGETCSDLCLCMDEVFSNIVKYAYDDGEEHEIEILFDFDELNSKFTITINDDGKPFNPLDTEPPGLAPDLLEREIGGLGIFIVLNIMSSVEYNRIKRMNRLRMVKDIGSNT